MHTPLGLVFRAQRGLLGAWVVGLTLLGLLYGAIIPTIPDLVASNSRMADYVGGSTGTGDPDVLVNTFLAHVYVFMAVVSAGFIVASSIQMRGEDESGRAEVVMATSVSRARWMNATSVVACLGTAVSHVLTALALTVGYGLSSGEWDRVLRHVGGQLAYLPGALLIGGLAVAIYGWFPRRTALAWAALAYVALHVTVGHLFEWPRPLEALSPFWHLASVPVDDFAVRPFVLLLLVAAGLVVIGQWGYRRRDAVTG